MPWIAPPPLGRLNCGAVDVLAEEDPLESEDSSDTAGAKFRSPGDENIVLRQHIVSSGIEFGD
jgi:hypothetical protein